MIPIPHGGRLVSTQLGPREADRIRSKLHDLPKVWPEIGQLMDAEMIGVGAYSPLEGFMSRDLLEGVVRSSRLPSALPWTIPVLLSPSALRDRRTVELLRPGDEVALMDPFDRPIALLHLQEKFPLDRRRLAREIFQTTDLLHPNVAELARTGETCLSGPVELIDRLESPVEEYAITPAEARALFRERQWSSVAAFQTRNVPHLGHEHLQRMTLEREDVDALFIQPVLGHPRAGEYRPTVVLAAYRKLIESYLPTDRVLLGALPIAMRFAGPRAALFLAIVRKNFGCSHYIVGRDQAGRSGFYDPYDCHRIFDELPIGIVPVRFREAFYCTRCGQMVSAGSCPHPEADHILTSQTRIRHALRDGGPLPTEILRPEVLSILRQGDGLQGDETDTAASPAAPTRSPTAKPEGARTPAPGQLEAAGAPAPPARSLRAPSAAPL